MGDISWHNGTIVSRSWDRAAGNLDRKARRQVEAAIERDRVS
jgi:hypothetical protein